MKELLTNCDGLEEPLSTKPPLGGAEAKPQNSENPDFTPRDLNFIAEIVETETGECYPLDGIWQEPEELWVEKLRERKDAVIAANFRIHEHFVQKEGSDSDIAVATAIFTQITPELTAIAISQKEQGFLGPKSWNDVNPEACNRLDFKISQILNETGNNPTFEKNSSIKKSLEFIQTVLIRSDDPGFIYEEHSKFLKSCIEANEKGELIIYIPFESDYTHPVNSELESTQICEATATLMMPLTNDEREEFINSAKSNFARLKQRRHVHQINHDLNIIVGNDIMDAGFGIFSAQIGEAFMIKHKGSHEHGFYLAVNNLVKRQKYLEASNELVRMSEPIKAVTFYKTLEQLLTSHEQGHRLTLEYGKFGEVATDIPTVITALQKAYIGRAIDNKDYSSKINGIVCAILAEYVSGIIDTVSRDAWFEGHKANPENALFAGYLLSSVLIINAITDSGMVAIGSDGKININSSQENLTKLFNDLEEVNDKFSEKDLGTLEKIKDAVTNPEAERIISLYRDKIDEIEFRRSMKLIVQTESKTGEPVIK